jgi:hypothetical protein
VAGQIAVEARQQLALEWARTGWGMAMRSSTSPAKA